MEGRVAFWTTERSDIVPPEIDKLDLGVGKIDCCRVESMNEWAIIVSFELPMLSIESNRDQGRVTPAMSKNW
jgi:hypothetical protein